MRFGLALVAILTLTAPALAQDFTYRGFGEVDTLVYPQTTEQDPDHVATEGRLRFEPAYRAARWLTLAGSLEARLDNLGQVDREWRLDVGDRGLLRPAFSLRHAQASLRRGGASLDVGKQFIRWGKADILNPTDRFAPKDFVEVTEEEFLAVTGARAIYERGSQTLDLVWVPLFTPSRIPIIGRRWAPVASPAPGSPALQQSPADFPERGQYGARWNAIGSAFELSVSYFDGFNHLPYFTSQFDPDLQVLAVQPTYAPLRMVGGDAAVPLRWFTVKGEAASLFATSEDVDDVVLYVVQIERQSGELSLVAGYAGEIVTARRAAVEFAPDRGLTRAFLGRAGYTLGPTRDVAVEAAVRQNLAGVWLKARYSQAVGSHWRWTVAGVAIGGDEDDFIGQYEGNSHVQLTLRYSF